MIRNSTRIERPIPSLSIPIPILPFRTGESRSLTDGGLSPSEKARSFRQWLPISRIRVEVIEVIEIEIEIGIGIEIEIGIGIGIGIDSYFCTAHGPHEPLKPYCRVLSAPQQYGYATRFLVSEFHPVSFR